jgi:hypothetical protein
MTRLPYAAVPLAILALVFSGCASRGPDSTSAQAIKPVEQPYRAGTGVVQAVTAAPCAFAAGPTAAAGDTTAARNPALPSTGATSTAGLQRLRIRMDDGRTVYVDTPSRDFAPGTRVQLSEANQIQRQ